METSKGKPLTAAQVARMSRKMRNRRRPKESKTARIREGKIVRGEVLSAALDASRCSESVSESLILYLADATSAARRDFRRFIAQSGLGERVCESTVNAEGDSVPLALEVYGGKAIMEALKKWLHSSENRMIRAYHNKADIPVFIGQGESGERLIGESGRRAMKRQFMRKAERTAREIREDSKAFASVIFKDERMRREAFGQTPRIAFKVPTAQPAQPLPRVDCGKIVIDTREPSYAELFADRCRIETAYHSLRSQWLRDEIARLESERREAEAKAEETARMTRGKGDARRFGSTGIAANRIQRDAIARIIQAEKERREKERRAKERGE